LACSLLCAARAEPLVKIEGLRQISDHVYIIPNNNVPVIPNVGYVVGDHAVLVIDTGPGPPNGEAYGLRWNIQGVQACRSAANVMDRSIARAVARAAILRTCSGALPPRLVILPMEPALATRD
jgi:hypothetical protein